MVIADGRIVEAGTHQELLAKDGVYHTLYEMQFKFQEQADALELDAEPRPATD
jgi:ABC-type transport system involved in cytochrome bd biosynthesis fused ATPase/permease subunit